MTISWFGHASFRLSAKGGSASGGETTTVLFDPFSKEIGLRPPRIHDTIVLVSHEHFDHNNIEGAGPETFIIRSPGEYEKSGIQVVGVLSEHDNTGGTERGLNTIYVVKLEDIRVCHLGDIGQYSLRDEQVEAIGEIDVLLVPVGGTYTVDGSQAMELVKQLEPKIVIPMHYKIPGLTIALDGPEKFLKEVGIKPQEIENLKIVAKNLPAEDMQVYTFKI